MELITSQVHLENLVDLAKTDLSQAHLAQHSYTATLAANIGNISIVGPGAFSSEKPQDTVQLIHNKVSGTKFWVSNGPAVDWAVLHINNNVVYVDLDNSVGSHVIPIMGMENTLTANLTFDQTTGRTICDINDPSYFVTRRIHSLSFIAVSYGLSLSLYSDLNNYTQSQKIACDYHMQKLRLQLDVMQLLWEQLPKQVSLDHQDHYYWVQKNTVYAYAKKCLTEICQLVTEVTGSSLYLLENKYNQRYRDALIYSTHMKNLYHSTKVQNDNR